MSGQETQPVISESGCPLVVEANPSNVIKHHQRVLNISGSQINLTLITMKRSFLLVVSNESNSGPTAFEEPTRGDNSDSISKEDMIRGFMGSNSTLKGLSLAIGGLNTCIVNSENSLASATLASRLSKKCNNNRPVYVANNFQFPHDTVDPDEFSAKLYLKIFQFVRANYKCDSVETT